MKSKIILMAILLCFTVAFAGCSTMNSFIGSESGQAVMEHGGVIAGVFVGSNNLDKIDEIVGMCDDYLKEENEVAKQVALEVVTIYIFKKYGQTPQTMLVMAEVQKLAGVLLKDGKIQFLENYKPELLEKFILSFRNGVAIATPRQTKFIPK